MEDNRFNFYNTANINEEILFSNENESNQTPDLTENQDTFNTNNEIDENQIPQIQQNNNLLADMEPSRSFMNSNTSSLNFQQGQNEIIQSLQNLSLIDDCLIIKSTTYRKNPHVQVIKARDPCERRFRYFLLGEPSSLPNQGSQQNARIGNNFGNFTSSRNVPISFPHSNRSLANIQNPQEASTSRQNNFDLSQTTNVIANSAIQNQDSVETLDQNSVDYLERHADVSDGFDAFTTQQYSIDLNTPEHSNSLNTPEHSNYNSLQEPNFNIDTILNEPQVPSVNDWSSFRFHLDYLPQAPSEPLEPIAGGTIQIQDAIGSLVQNNLDSPEIFANSEDTNEDIPLNQIEELMRLTEEMDNLNRAIENDVNTSINNNVVVEAQPQLSYPNDELSVDNVTSLNNIDTDIFSTTRNRRHPSCSSRVNYSNINMELDLSNCSTDSSDDYRPYRKRQKLTKKAKKRKIAIPCENNYHKEFMNLRSRV